MVSGVVEAVAAGHTERRRRRRRRRRGRKAKAVAKATAGAEAQSEGEAAMGGDGQSSENVRSYQLAILLLKRPQKNPSITHTQRTHIKDKQRNRQIRERNMKLNRTHKIGDTDTGKDIK